MENKVKILVVGTGYVGLVSGVCLSEIGHEVICVDSDSEKIDGLKNGKLPIYEPGLDELVVRNMQAERISFSADLNQYLYEAEVIIIAVGTPSAENGETNLTYVFEVVKQLSNLPDNAVVVVKSTVPPGTCNKVAELLHAQNGKRFDVVSNPEFLREGNAIEDFMKPDRIIVGCETSSASEVMGRVYAPLTKNGIEIINTNRITSELIKYASNTFLAAKVAFINEMSSICEKVSANILDLKKGLGSDSRIGPKFLQPGPGFGGSCFPKDISSLIYFSDDVGSNNILIKSIIESNERRILEITNNIKNIVKNGDVITILGLTYKANTDDVRTSPAVDIADYLSSAYNVKAYDPMGTKSAKKILKDKIHYCKDVYEAIQDSSLVVVATEWDEFRSLDPMRIKSLMKSKVIYDVRGIIDYNSFDEAGFEVKIVGMSDGRKK